MSIPGLKTKTKGMIYDANPTLTARKPVFHIEVPATEAAVYEVTHTGGVIPETSPK